jgi:hypothetical protein
MRRGPAYLAAGLLAAALLVGCGGGDSSTETALSKATYVKRANLICATANDELEASAKGLFGSRRPTEQELKGFATTFAVPRIEDELAQLRALPAPSGDEQTVSAIYDAAEQGLTKLKQDPRIITEDNPQAFAKANKLARAYGIDVCAS